MGNYFSRKARVGLVTRELFDVLGPFDCSIAELIDNGEVTSARLHFLSKGESVLLFEQQVFSIPEMGRHDGHVL
jgi:hypothetical protein